MKYMDIKPQPTTKLEVFDYWMNDMTSQFVTATYSGGRKIEVKEPELVLLDFVTFSPSKCFVCGRPNCEDCDESDFYDSDR